MRKKIVITIFVLIIVAVFLILYMDKNLTLDTNKPSSISLDGYTFDVSVDEFIAIINDDLQKKDMKPISTQYKTERYSYSNGMDANGEETSHECIEYNAKICDGLSIKFYQYPELGDNIAVILLECKDSPSLKADLNNLADDYYKVICQNVEPKFDVDNFKTHSKHNEHYVLDDLIFYCVFVNVQEGNDEIYDKRTYGISAADLDDTYSTF